MAKRAQNRAPSYATWRIRSRFFITLDDQSFARTLAPSLFRFEGRDQTWNSHVESFIEVNRPQLTAIDVEPHLSPSPNEIKLELKAGGTIGAVPLLTPDSQKVMGGIVVRPRFGWEGIGSVLSRIGWAASPNVLDFALVPGSAREVRPWVLAGPILTRLRTMLREIKRGFKEKEEVRQAPRGQIIWQRYVSQELIRGSWHHIPCRYPELESDPLLRAFIKWGLERLYHSLAAFVSIDVIAALLSEQIQELLLEVADTHALVPDKRIIKSIQYGAGLPSKGLSKGLEALSWLVDERGLAGITEQDGLAWTLPMADLFEKWVNYLVSQWARGIGGNVSVGYRGQTLVPITWEHHSFDSLNSLVPDVVVRLGDHTYIFDAKYKSHLEELDEQRWQEVGEELHAQHRQDVHQILAYASLYGTSEVTAVLVYPMRLSSWQHLARTGHTQMRASIYQDNRQLQLILTGVPLHFMPGDFEDNLLRSWIETLGP